MNRIYKTFLHSAYAVFFLLFAGPYLSEAAITKLPPGLPGPGDIIAPVTIPSPKNSSYAAYLGLEGQSRFQPAQLNAEMLVIEVFNVYCASCQIMRPYMNELFSKIETDSELKGRVKMMAIGAGNDQWDIAPQEKLYDFPIIADDDYRFHKLVGRPPTPFLIFARPHGAGQLLVVDSHLGRLEDSDVLLSMVRRAFRTDVSRLAVKASETSGSAQEEMQELSLPVSEKQLMARVKQSLTLNGKEAQDITEISLPGWGRIFSGKSVESRRTLFARVVARRIPCGDCHDVFYVYSFDADGNFIRFVPISIFKYGNQPWDAADAGKIQLRLQDRSLSTGIQFDSKVDAVSSATISSELVFHSIGQTAQVIEALKKQGFIQK